MILALCTGRATGRHGSGKCNYCDALGEKAAEPRKKKSLRGQGTLWRKKWPNAERLTKYIVKGARVGKAKENGCQGSGGRLGEESEMSVAR